MKKEILTANVLFSGAGMQECGIEESGLFDLNVMCTSEINIGAILMYAGMHHNMTMKDVEEFDNYPPIDDMILELETKNIGFNPKTKKPYNWKKFKKSRSIMIKKVWLAVQMNHNLGDISRISRLPYADLWTISFPCQNISCAGDMKGFKPGSGTKSSLLWDNIRLLKKSVDMGESPKYLLFENVKSLVSKKFKQDFNTLLDILDDLGFNSYWQVVNAKHCLIPQNRERVFVVCIQKEIDKGKWQPLVPVKLKSSLIDYLDEDVDESYYLSEERTKYFIDTLIMDGKIEDPDDIVSMSAMMNEIENSKEECMDDTQGLQCCTEREIHTGTQAGSTDKAEVGDT